MMQKRNIFILPVLCFYLNAFPAEIQEQKDSLKLGGAIRFNTFIKNFEESEKSLDAAAVFDAFILSADAHRSGFDLSFQYRFYPESKTHFFRHAFIGYEIDNHWYAKLGVIQKPFGIGDYASHNWFFQLPYYLGLEDRDAMGIHLRNKRDRWTFDLAYFRQASPAGPVKGDDSPVGNGRYSYAIVNTTGISKQETVSADIRELDQFNARIRHQTTKQVELGLSAQYGRIYNAVQDKSDWGTNWAIHLVYDHMGWNFKGEVVGYNYNSRSDDGSKLDAVQMAAYGSAYDVAAKGTIYVAGLSHKIVLGRKFINSITPYVDYSYLDKRIKSYHATHHLVPGVMILSGPIYTYMEYAMGKNQPWFSSSFTGLAEGHSDARWNGRFNINIGYYF